MQICGECSKRQHPKKLKLAYQSKYVREGDRDHVQVYRLDLEKANPDLKR